MIAFEPLLIVAAACALVVWAVLSAHVLAVQRRRERMRALLDAALDFLRPGQFDGLAPEARTARLTTLLQGASRELVMRAAADAGTPADAFDAFAVHLGAQWGRDRLLVDARSHRSVRDKWRRITALKILWRLDHPERFTLAARALAESDAEIAGAALALLGQADDPRAMDLLFDALRAQRHPASLVAAHIERSPVLAIERLRTLLTDDSPVLRLWSCTLLAGYPDAGIEAELLPLTHDPDPRVRKASIQTLGQVGALDAADRALALLGDPISYVRAHAARALGELGRADRAADVAQLLGDSDWWARLAARQALEQMGADVWPVLMRCLESEDRFVRNGAAEVFQNIGVLDSLIVMEAASDNPAGSKIAMLQRIAAAGGLRFTESLVERAGPALGPRVRQLLSTIGIAHVGAY